eukprot:scaffold62300_cov54-Attheya_sp.AAC.2
MDVLESSGGNHGEEEKRRVVNFVTEHAAELLGARPIVIPISAQDALSTKLMHAESNRDNSRVWQRSNFATLESFLKDSLTTETKMEAKLTNPIGVAEAMIHECLVELSSRRKELKADISTLNLLESQMAGWTKDMEHSMKDFREEIRHLLLQQGESCHNLVNGMSLVDQWKWTVSGDYNTFEMEWSKLNQMIASSPEEIERAILQIIRENSDDVATRARAQGQAVIEYLGRRPAIKSQSLVNDSSSIGTGSLVAIQNSMRTTMMASTGIHAVAILSAVAGALGMVNLTAGLLSSVVLTCSGAYLVPFQNQQMAKDHQARWMATSDKLHVSLEDICSKELQRVQKRILDGVSPYTRYVHTEQERIAKLTEECETILSGTNSLRRRIHKVR